jgi:hypothetical protein
MFAVIGLVWFLSGTFLVVISAVQAVNSSTLQVLVVFLLGVLLAFAIYYSAVRKIVTNNIHRIVSMPEKVHMTAIGALKTYMSAVFLLLIGIVILFSSLPHEYIAVFTISVGGSLIIGSISFFRRYFNQSLKAG